MINRNDVENNVNDYVVNYIDENFEFREHQKETIIDIILNILEHKHKNYIVEAPTGSGKSLINIISAGVLDVYYNVTSYILVSDLFLWQQYEDFLKKYPLVNIAALKGQTGNYICSMNEQDIRNSDCRMAGLSWSALFNKSIIEKYKYTCAYNCEYLIARKKAIKSNVCILTYQLFLSIMNNSQSNKDGKGGSIFKEHDVLFCDECHNIPGIVQMEYAPTITLDSFDKICEILNFDRNEKFNLFVNQDKISSNQLTPEKAKENLMDYWNKLLDTETRKDEDFEYIKKYIDILVNLTDICQNIDTAISNKKIKSESFTKEDIKIFKLSSWYKNYFSHWQDFLDAINNTGTEYLLKDINISNEDNSISISFKCIKEDYLVYRYLLSKANYKVFLSATVGGKNAYDENMGFKYDFDEKRNEELNNSKLVRVPSTFDFSNSPIHFLNKFKMSFKEKDISFIHLKSIIYSICSTKFKNEKGIIQTGSYEFAKKIYNEAPYEIKKRMLLYGGSREKNIMVKLHQTSENTILVGPTLTEGVDLPGNDCRFIIILKVPFPSMANKLVKEKIKLFPLWYNSTTSNEIIQGIGRGVRYNGDWCVTYILDACFWNLYLSTKEQYPKELQKRINII